MLQRTVRYLGNVEVIDVPPALGVSEVKRYIGGALVITLRSDGGGSKAYLYTDPQGSTDLVTDRFGNVGEYCRFSPPTGCRQIGQRQGFDAFGLRRRVETAPVWDVLPWAQRQGFDPRATSRGYTGHESVDPVGLVHMNGRLYDPLIGRFIQPDPIVQDPYDTQSHNRYSYVLNNPLSAADPSGNLSVRQAVLTVAAIVVTFYTGGTAAALLAESAFVEAAAVAAAGGFVAGGLTTGTLKGALAGSFGSLATMGVGASFTGVGQVLAQGAVGGVMSELQGGKFGHGFASAGMSAALNPAIAQGVQGDAGQLVAHAVLGGTASAVAGGKFANGAVTAAFAYAFGQMSRGGNAVDAETAPRRMTERELNRRVRELRGGTTLGDAKDVARSRITTYCTSGADCSEINVASFDQVTFNFSRLDFDPNPVQGSLGLSLATNDLDTIGVVDLYPGALVLADKASPAALAGRLIHEFIHETQTNT